MKLLMENWRNYLEEEQIEEKLALKKGKNGWWMYSQLVAQAYREAPMYDSAAEEGYRALAECQVKLTYDSPKNTLILLQKR